MVYCLVKPYKIYPSFVPYLIVASLNFKLRLELNLWCTIIIEKSGLLFNAIFPALRIFLRKMVVRVCAFMIEILLLVIRHLCIGTSTKCIYDAH